MTSRHVVGPLLLAFTMLAQVLGASTSTPFQIAPSPSLLISIANADENACNEAAGLTTDDTVETLRKFAVVVTNNSSLSVNALTVVWTLVEPTGHVITQTFLSDSYMRPTLTSVIPPHGRAIMWPLVMYRRHDDGSWTSHHLSPNTSLAGKFSVATSVTVTLDFVATSDGQYSGDDTRRTLESIRSRKQAATEIANAIRHAQSSGKSVDDVIAQISASNALARSELDKWRQRFTGQLMRPSVPREGFTRYLESLPDVPSFKRSSLTSGGLQ